MESINKRESRKEMATSFLQLVVDGKISEAYEVYVNPKMRHHNAFFPGDAQSLQKGMERDHAKFPNKTLDIKHSLEDKDLVAVHSHVRPEKDKPGIAVLHLFRFENNKIVEMWDIGQEIP